MREIYKGVKHRLACEDGVASLTIAGVDHTDAGNYRCELYNQHGRAESTANLVVYGMASGHGSSLTRGFWN